MPRLQIEVDADNMLGRQFTELERSQLPFAVMQACNATAFEIRETWKRTAPRVFDRPTRMTINAAQVHKATKQRLYAQIFIRDLAHKGTPPAKYLLPQVAGGDRRPKGMERLLMSKGAMPQGMFAVPGKGAPMDAYGNVRSGVVRQIISQAGAGLESGYTSNETEVSRKRRRARRNSKRGDFFVIKKKHGRLLPGVYERFKFGAGSIVRSIFVFVRSVRYQPRYNIFGLAERQWNKLMPFYFNRELQKAIETSKFRGRR